MKVRAEKINDRIQLRAPYPLSGVKEIIPGAYFSSANPADPHWRVPLTMAVCHLLRETYGHNLSIGPNLRAWASAEITRTEQLTVLGKSHDAELTRLPEASPRLAAAMEGRKYQKSGAKFVVDGGHVLISDDPGLGKTLECIGGILESGIPGPYLVICPKTASESVWAPELARWAPGAQVITVPEGRAVRDEILDTVCAPGLAHARTNLWVVVHPAMVRTKSFWECQNICDEEDLRAGEVCHVRTPFVAGKKTLICGHNPYKAPTVNEHEFPQLFGVSWGAVVVDESHEVLITKDKRGTLARRGAMCLHDAMRPNGLRVALSGTPWRSRPHLLWGTLNWLNPKKYPGKWQWVQLYWKTGGYTGFEIQDFITEREQMMYDSLNAILLRRTKAEVATDLPPKRYAGTPIDPDDDDSPVGVWLEMTPQQRKAHESIVKSASADLEGGKLDALGVLAERTRMKQFASNFGKMVGGDFKPSLPSNKFDYICEMLESRGFPGSPTDPPVTKVIIVSQFAQTLELYAAELRKKLKVESLMITGKVTGAKRAEAIARFNTEDPPYVMFLQTKTGGVAITIDTADEMVIVDETDVDDDQIQVEDRIHRVSNPRKVMYHYLRSLDSIEMGIARVNYEAKKRGRRILDERRGVAWFREVVEHSVRPGK